MKNIRILIADDHPLFREGLRVLLDVVPGVELVGEACDGADVIARASELNPDVILMDIGLPRLNGIEATRQILRVHPSINILMVTMYEDDGSVFAAMRAGARGYVLKGADQGEVEMAIQIVNSGGVIFSPTIAHRVMHFFATYQPVTAQIFPELTGREREILHLLAKGYNNATIAQRLIVSPKTVRNLVSSILSKLQVTDRAEAMIRAREAGMGNE